MQKKTHIAFGAALGAAVLQVAPISITEEQVLLYASGLVIGSLLPDVDHPGSTLGRKLPGISHLISAVFGHRKFFHSLLFVGLLALVLPTFLPSAVCIGLLIGVASHLLGDMMTHSGIQLFFPVKWMVKFPLTFRTGGIVEYALFFVFSGVAIFMGSNMIGVQEWF